MGVHINAIGSYQPERLELDDTIRRCRLVVEDRSIAFLKAGDLAIPAAAGRLRPADVAADLADLIGGAVARASSQDITVFKSVRVAHEDLAVAHAALHALDAPRRRLAGGGDACGTDHPHEVRVKGYLRLYVSAELDSLYGEYEWQLCEAGPTWQPLNSIGSASS